MLRKLPSSFTVSYDVMHAPKRFSVMKVICLSNFSFFQ